MYLRAPFQVLVFPYRKNDIGNLEFGIFRLFGSHILPNVVQKFLKLRGKSIFFFVCLEAIYYQTLFKSS